MAIRLHLFDLMDTVVEDPFRREVPRVLGLSLEEILAVKNPGAWLRFESGELDEAGYVASFYRDGVVDPPFTPVEFRRAMLENIRFMPGMEELLSELAGSGARLAIASNYSPWIHAVCERLGLDRFFGEVYVSCELGVRKPDPLFHERLLERAGVPPEEVLFVDDREPNVRAAAALGMRAVRFEGSVALRREI